MHLIVNARTRWLLACLLCVFGFSAWAADLTVIPQPREVESRDGKFMITRHTQILLSEPRDEDDRFAAAQLIDEVSAWTGAKPTMAAFSGRAKEVSIVLLRAPSTNAAVQRLLRDKKIEIDDQFNSEGYVIDVSPSQVIVAANTPQGIFYGVQTLKQLLMPEANQRASMPALRIRDWPAMRYRGLHDDISRGPVPTLDYIKKQIRLCAEYKLNLYSFYIEHTFDYQSHPLIGPKESSLTTAEIKAIVAYAKKFHIEIVPEQQAFGHLHHALKWEKYQELAELPHGHVLTPTQEKTYAFIKELYDELVPLFPGKFFHIGADETWELGQGQTKKWADEKGVGKVYFDHILRVSEMMKPYQKELMFWSDIALGHSEFLPQLPKDMIAMVWTYSPQENFDRYLKPFKDAGLRMFVCPGVNNWNRIFPNHNNALPNIRNFVRDGQRMGAMGMLNTTWDDDGEAIFEMTWYGVLFGAAAAWQPGESSTDTFGKNFDWAFYRNHDHTFQKVIANFDQIHQTLRLSGVGDGNDGLFWSNFFTEVGADSLRRTVFQAAKIRLLAEESLELLYRHRARAKRNAETLDALIFAAKRFDALGMKILFSNEISKLYWQAYRNLSDRQNVSRSLDFLLGINGLIYDLRDTMSALRNDYRKLWLAENRPYWLENVLVKYDLEVQRWAALAQKIAELQRQYSLKGTLPAPEELGFFMK